MSDLNWLRSGGIHEEPKLSPNRQGDTQGHRDPNYLSRGGEKGGHNLPSKGCEPLEVEGSQIVEGGYLESLRKISPKPHQDRFTSFPSIKDTFWSLHYIPSLSEYVISFDETISPSFAPENSPRIATMRDFVNLLVRNIILTFCKKSLASTHGNRTREPQGREANALPIAPLSHHSQLPRMANE